MGLFTSAPYAGAGDREAIRAFIVAAAAADPAAAYFHVGDLLWALYQNTVFDPTADVRLWRDASGQLVGFAWFDRPAAVDLQIHPRLRGDGALETEMVAWAETRRAVCLAGAEASDPQHPLAAYAFAPDARAVDALLALGFAPAGDLLVHHWRALDADGPLRPLPSGFAVRQVGGEAEWPARVDLHREIWHPSQVTLAAYRRLRAVPGYRPDLDLVAVAPGGTLAAYAIAWWDPTNRTGLFEPVGTRATFRGRGLARAVLDEGLRRLRALGATRAVVNASPDAPPALALYRAAGFREAGRFRTYRRRS